MKKGAYVEQKTRRISENIKLLVEELKTIKMIWDKMASTSAAVQNCENSGCRDHNEESSQYLSEGHR